MEGLLGIEIERLEKEWVVALFEVISRYLSRNEENHENPQSG
jgi:hypothetical protein